MMSVMVVLVLMLVLCVRLIYPGKRFADEHGRKVGLCREAGIMVLMVLVGVMTVMLVRVVLVDDIV